MSIVPYLVFFASGFAALVDQIVWQRLLAIFSGSDIHSATVIVAAFMAGLGCGNLAGARVADRLPRAMTLAAFVAAELAIAAFGFFSAELYYDVLYRRLGHVAIGIEARGAVLFISLLWPTFFMGVSLPLLARALTATIGRAASVTGGLYACNTAGAAIGAFVGTWVLLPAFGLETTLRISAVVNLCAAAGALPLALAARRPLEEDAAGRSPTAALAGGGADDRAPVVPFATWALLYALSGFLALSLEIIWFRLLGVMLKSTAFTFGTLLCIYLAGIGLGAAACALLIPRVRRPAHMFLTLQAAIAIYAGLSVAMLFAVVDSGSVPVLSQYFGGYEALDVAAAVGAVRLFVQGGGQLPRQFLLLYFLVPAVLIGPPTLLMGASFPLLQKAVQTDVARVGARVGVLLTANIAGSTLGSIVTGWGLLGWFGTSGTLRLLVAAAAAYPVCALMLWSRIPAARRRLAYAATIAALAMVVAAMPDSRTLWARVHGSTRPFVVVGEDGSGASVLRMTPEHQRRVVVFVNGIGQSWLPYGGIHTALGALPAFIHPNPRHAAVIGLGSGDTLFAIAGRQEFERITCIEIVRPQLDTLRRLHETWQYAGLRWILADPRIAHVYGDGRQHVSNAGAVYDVIEADALRPTSAYSGNLYSDAYFALMRDRLKPGGLAVSWSPTARVHNTFVKVFPHVLSYGDIVVGSNQPIELDADTVRARLAHPNVQAHYRESGIDIYAVLAPYLERRPRIFGPADDRTAIVDINTDLYPKDEFSVPPATAR